MSSNLSPESILDRFSLSREVGKGVLIPYLTAGYPDAGTSLELMKALAQEGGDILELGIPFSDPLADGPTIQRSSFRALEGGMTVKGTLRLLERFRAVAPHPVVLFSYLNPILRYGMVDFLRDAVNAGAQGLLLTDLPAGGDPGLEKRMVEGGLDLIRLVAPTTPPERVAEIAEGGAGFLYYISRTGVTGARTDLRAELGREVEAIRRRVALPIAVGFGISSPDQAALVASVADGVVVGSALIDALDEGGVSGASSLLASLREGMDASGLHRP
ncbi:tryptophan synthase subunit alpha [Gemmatimonadota bacterium]